LTCSTASSPISAPGVAHEISQCPVSVASFTGNPSDGDRLFDHDLEPSALDAGQHVGGIDNAAFYERSRTDADHPEHLVGAQDLNYTSPHGYGEVPLPL
jgi:hypothetical protein